MILEPRRRFWTSELESDMTVSHIKVGTKDTEGEETAGVCENKQEKGSKNNVTGKEGRNIQGDRGQAMREEGKELVA